MLADDAHPNYWLEAAAKIVSERPIIRNGWVIVNPNLFRAQPASSEDGGRSRCEERRNRAWRS